MTGRASPDVMLVRKVVALIADNFFDSTRIDPPRLLEEMLTAVARRSDGALRLQGTVVVARTGQRWSARKPISIWEIPIAARDLVKFLLDTIPPDHRLVRGAFPEVVMANAMLGTLDATSIVVGADAYAAFRGERSPLADALRAATAREYVKTRLPGREIMDRLRAANVLYIAVDTMDQEAVGPIRRALEVTHATGAILDLRGSAGGPLQSVADLADLFLATGPIVAIKGPKTDELKMAHTEGSHAERIKLAVIVDSHTAAGGEIFAGALRSGGRAVLVGVTTAGVGTIQVYYDLKDPTTGKVCALELSIAQAVLPGNQPFEAIGLTPDVRVSSPESPRKEAAPGCAPVGEEIATIHRDDPDAAVLVAAEILEKSSGASRDDLLAAAKAIAAAQHATSR